MARPKATPEQREEIRRGIQLAAAAIYRETGIGGISARAVAKEAGVSVGAIYAHFGDLTTLMQSLWMGHVDKQNAKFEAVAQEHADPVERMSALMRAYLNFGIKNAQLYRSAFLFVRPESHDTPEVQPLASMAFGALLIAAIQEGQSAGTVMPGEPEISSCKFYGQACTVLWLFP